MKKLIMATLLEVELDSLTSVSASHEGGRGGSVGEVYIGRVAPLASADPPVDPSPAACVSQACAALLPPRPFCERVRDVLFLCRANSLLTTVQPSASGPTVGLSSDASVLLVAGSARRKPLLFLARRPFLATAAVRSVLLLVERTSSEGPSRDVDSG